MGRHFITSATIAVGLAMLAASSHAATPPVPRTSTPVAALPPLRTTDFNLIGDNIIVPLPAGYCPASGRFEGIAQLTAAADKENLTTASLYLCDDIASDTAPTRYALVKTPRKLLLVKASRSELLAEMGAIPPSELGALMNSENLGKEASKSASEVLGAKTEIGVNIQPVAADEYGYYITGTGQGSAGTQTFQVCFAGVLTTIKGHVIAYYFYAPGQTLGDIAAVLALTKAEVRRLIKANGD